MSSSVVVVAAEKQMEDVKTGPMELDTAAAQELVASDGGGLGGFEGPTTGSLSEATALANAGPPSPLTGCYLLIILGEPHSEEALRVIVDQLKQGK